MHFGEARAAGVGAYAVIFVVDDDNGAVFLHKLVDMIGISELLGGVVERGKFKALAVEAYRVFAVCKLNEVCTVVVSAFLGLDHRHEFTRYSGAVYAVARVREHIDIGGLGAVDRKSVV